MRIKASTAAIWLGATALIALAVSAAASPRTRYDLLSLGGKLLEFLSRGTEVLHGTVQGRLGRRISALEEIGATLDAATSQYDSSLMVSKVAAALGDDPSLRGRKVGVRMIGGILHLEGEVQSQHERLRAAEVSKRASGAEVIANDLKVASQIS